MQIDSLIQILYPEYTKNIDLKSIDEFYSLISDLVEHPIVLQMKNYRQHYNTSCYEHCLEVAYWSYLYCKKHHLDYKSMARAALLHDLFLYDWRHSHEDLQGWHAFIHPQIALKNASKFCILNDMEKDIIAKHMWPVTFFRFPKYKESYILTITDKLSALKSFRNYYKSIVLKKKFIRYAYIFFAFTVFKIL